MAQTKEELEKWYEKEDPWGYQNNDDDINRRVLIADIADTYLENLDRTLDIGCGEGFVTEALPGLSVEGIELSEKAGKRMKYNKLVTSPRGKYSLITACGVLYDHYDYRQMREWIEKHASEIVLTCHYDKMGEAHDKFDFEQIFYAEFKYREGKQILRVYRV